MTHVSHIRYRLSIGLLTYEPINTLILQGGPFSPADLGLTERQMDVLTLITQGSSKKAICRALDLSEPTHGPRVVIQLGRSLLQ